MAQTRRAKQVLLSTSFQSPQQSPLYLFLRITPPVLQPGFYDRAAGSDGHAAHGAGFPDGCHHALGEHEPGQLLHASRNLAEAPGTTPGSAAASREKAHRAVRPPAASNFFTPTSPAPPVFTFAAYARVLSCPSRGEPLPLPVRSAGSQRATNPVSLRQAPPPQLPSLQPLGLPSNCRARRSHPGQTTKPQTQTPRPSPSGSSGAPQTAQ